MLCVSSFGMIHGGCIKLLLIGEIFAQGRISFILHLLLQDFLFEFARYLLPIFLADLFKALLGRGFVVLFDPYKEACLWSSQIFFTNLLRIVSTRQNSLQTWLSAQTSICGSPCKTALPHMMAMILMLLRCRLWLLLLITFGAKETDIGLVRGHIVPPRIIVNWNELSSAWSVRS